MRKASGRQKLLKAATCKRMYDRRCAAGLCVRCGVEAVAGKTLCFIHAEKSRLVAVSRKAKIRDYKKTIRAEENARKRTPEYKEKRNKNRRERKQNDPAWAMADRIRKRIGRAMRDYAPGMKLRKTQNYLRCTMDEFVQHIERNFLPGMSIENRHLWHIDHRRPCASYDLTDPEQQKACFRWSNLFPMWAMDNIKKHAKWNPMEVKNGNFAA